MSKLFFLQNWADAISFVKNIHPFKITLVSRYSTIAPHSTTVSHTVWNGNCQARSQSFKLERFWICLTIKSKK